MKNNCLKEFRIKKQMNQEEIAKYLNISQSQYSNLETGFSIINAKQLLQLSELYQCTPNDLLNIRERYQKAMEEIDQD